MSDGFIFRQRDRQPRIDISCGNNEKRFKLLDTESASRLVVSFLKVRPLRPRDLFSA